MIIKDLDQTGITTELEHDANGKLRIRSVIKLQQGSCIGIESLWKPDYRNSNPEMLESNIQIGGLALPLAKAPALLAHRNLIQDVKECPHEVQTLPHGAEHPKTSLNTVHLATRHDGAEVFLDPLSAAFWARDCRRVKEVSVESAAFALKTDRNSVVESATCASEETWEIINVVLSILSLAKELDSHVSQMGISLKDLRTKRPET
ncbi:MAG: hypothetical protein JSW61_08215 [Candidatus Thorarchaeota archaeon]|nr:MAG: hypothetical protein JSW61_08215 [Candidatus Thorarchaeota archaeon]